MAHANPGNEPEITPFEAQTDDPEGGSTWFISLASVVIFIAIVLAVCDLYFFVENRLVEEVQVDAPIKAFQDGKQAQLAQLASYERYSETDADGKTVERIRIPIDRAFEVVVARQAGGSAR
jgi:hypothetical protein